MERAQVYKVAALVSGVAVGSAALAYGWYRYCASSRDAACAELQNDKAQSGELAVSRAARAAVAGKGSGGDNGHKIGRKTSRRSAGAVKQEEKEALVSDLPKGMSSLEKILLKDLAECVEQLGKEERIDEKTERSNLKRMQRAEASIHTYSPATRVLVAQYCLMMFQQHAKTLGERQMQLERESAATSPGAGGIGVPEALESFRATYLESAWDILDKLNNGKSQSLELLEDDDMRGKLCATQLDVAFMLQDEVKIHTLYDKATKPLFASIRQASKTTIMMALVTAASCGVPENVVRFGKLLKNGELEGVHAGALEDPTRVDYAALHSLANQLRGPGASSPSVLPELGKDLEWKAYRVLSARFRASSAEMAAGAILRPNLVPNKLTDMSLQPGTCLLRSGAVVHLVNPGPIPLPLSGFASGPDALLFGYVDIAQTQEVLRVTNSLTMKRAPSGKVWVGKELCSMVAIAGPRAGHKLCTVVLDVELRVEEDPSSLWRTL
ncbi:hypothetical protein FVE85_5897 [Porphyridium purpureum]|uniref:Uncharacterized protein n=1 Tax=Porphyridium purpureum TaxID=35688 RepID=A0A5J4Z5E9_PORPP|nr:hypothetical protein FVE85_5897 [Porphyridium purpureum]|eukprot:POR8974..scf295_1